MNTEIRADDFLPFISEERTNPVVAAAVRAVVRATPGHSLVGTRFTAMQSL